MCMVQFSSCRVLSSLFGRLVVLLFLSTQSSWNSRTQVRPAHTNTAASVVTLGTALHGIDCSMDGILSISFRRVIHSSLQNIFGIAWLKVVAVPDPLPRGQNATNQHCGYTVTSARLKSSSSRFRRYRITTDDFEAMTLAQAGLCAICERPEEQVRKDGTSLPLSVDHCHRSNTIRLLLCGKCNRGLGLFRDDPDILRKAVEYLLLFDRGYCR
jgi:hypothetical protein